METYIIDAGGTLAALTDPRNFTPEMRAQRILANPREWRMEDHVDGVNIFDYTRRQTDFAGVLSDTTGLGKNQWLTEDIFNPEIKRWRDKIKELEVYVATLAESVALSDSRVELAEEFKIPAEMLMKRFWVFVQNNVQQTGNAFPHEITVIVRTHEERVPGKNTFRVTSPYIEQNYQDFLGQIRELIANPEEGKSIWWAKADPQGPGLNDPKVKKYPLNAELSAVDLLRRLADIEALEREIWVGSTGPIFTYPLRKTIAVKKKESSHWWLTIIDSSTGGVYIHNSVAGIEPKAGKLIENINWLLAAQTAEEWKMLADCRPTGLPLMTPLVRSGLRTPSPRQKNASDCGIFALSNLEAFINALSADSATGAYGAGLFMNINTNERRNTLRLRNKPVSRTNAVFYILTFVCGDWLTLL